MLADLKTAEDRILERKTLLTYPEVAEILRVSRRAVFHLVRIGRLDKVSICRSARITSASVRELIYGQADAEDDDRHAA